MKKMIWIVSVVIGFLVGSIAYAQFGKGTGPRFYSDFRPIVGGWSEYQMTSKGEPPSKMKIAIVGKEGDAFWYETVFEGKQEGKIVSKMLVSGNPGDKQNVKRMIFKTGNEPAMEMPVQMMQMQQGSQPQEPKGKMMDKGEETIKVPAGTFKTQHYQYQDEGAVVDAWVQKDVSPYGTVKTQSKAFEMVLTGYGTDAKTLITENPKKFEMPKMPRGMPKGSNSGKSEENDD